MSIQVLKQIASVLLLNGLLSFTSWWPTVAVKPDARISPEFSIVLVCLSLAVALGRRPSARTLKWLSGFYIVLIVGRYVDVVTPSLFGRAISLYWDVPQLPRFIWVTVAGSPWWVTVLAVLALCVSIHAFHRLVFACFSHTVDGLTQLQTTHAGTYLQGLHTSTHTDNPKPVTPPSQAHPRASRFSPWSALWAVYAPLAMLIGANYAGVQATWPYVSKPVLPTYMRELGVVADALIPERANRLLPASTVIDEALANANKYLGALKQRDVMLLFLESHGAVIYDNPTYASGVSDSLNALETSIARSGHQVVSAFFTSPTIGGASDLAHLSLLSGIDLSDPRRHDLLLTTRRPTLLTVFKRAGYEVYGVYHSVRWDWVERSYYGFDTYLSGPDFNYTGPEFGFWKIPDQYAMARLEQMHPRNFAAKPRMTVMSTMSTHFPFVPVPPYQPDWQRILGSTPFDEADASKAQSGQVNWMNMGPDYIRTLNYAHTWLAAWFEQAPMRAMREQIVIMVGDHQPTSNIAGEGATWDVPVYVVTRDASLLQALHRAGFSGGMRPAQRRSLGGLHDLTAVLMRVFRGAE